NYSKFVKSTTRHGIAASFAGVERSGTQDRGRNKARARGAGDSRLIKVDLSFCAFACFASSVSYLSLSWGSASLHPRLYAPTPLRGFFIRHLNNMTPADYASPVKVELEEA